MQIAIRIVVVAITVFILAKKFGILGEPSEVAQTSDSILPYVLGPSSSPKRSDDKLMAEKDITGITLDAFIASNLRRYIKIQGDEASFLLTEPAHTYDPKDYSYGSTWKGKWDGKSYETTYVTIRPVEIETFRDPYEEASTLGGWDLIVRITIVAKEHRSESILGPKGPPKWSNGIPDLPRFEITRKAGGNFIWEEIVNEHNPRLYTIEPA